MILDYLASRGKEKIHHNVKVKKITDLKSFNESSDNISKFNFFMNNIINDESMFDNIKEMDLSFIVNYPQILRIYNINRKVFMLYMNKLPMVFVTYLLKWNIDIFFDFIENEDLTYEKLSYILRYKLNIKTNNFYNETIFDHIINTRKDIYIKKVLMNKLMDKELFVKLYKDLTRVYSGNYMLSLSIRFDFIVKYYHIIVRRNLFDEDSCNSHITMYLQSTPYDNLQRSIHMIIKHNIFYPGLLKVHRITWKYHTKKGEYTILDFILQNKSLYRDFYLLFSDKYLTKTKTANCYLYSMGTMNERYKKVKKAQKIIHRFVSKHYFKPGGKFYKKQLEKLNFDSSHQI